MIGKPDETTAIAAAAIAASAPVAGEYAGIVIAALFGSLVALSRAKQSSRANSALFIFRSVVIASFMTGIAAKIVGGYAGIQAVELTIPLAFIIAFIGDDWFRLKDSAVGAARKRLGKEGE